ncbi:MAG: lamin tail domain-containing protein [Candidatus Eiseniibacteriota bacterium]
MRRAVLLLAWMLAAASPAAARTYGGREVPDAPLGRIAGTTPISQINANNASGFSPLEFFTVDIQGVVQVGTGRLDPFDQAGASAWFYVSDGTGGLAIARPGSIGTAVAPGDSVSVTSTVFTQGAAPIRGTRTLDLGFGGTVTVIGSGATAAPVVVTAADIVTNGAAWEGTRVRINALTIVNPGAWPAAGASAFVNVTDGVSTFRMYVDDETDLDGSAPPSAAFDLIGFVAQDDAPPFNDSHFVWPTSLADLVRGDGSGTATVSPPSVPEDATGVTLNFTFTGQVATLETIELDVPVAWGWTQSVTDVALGGAGFGAAAAGVVPGAPPTIRITGAAVTAAASGTLTVMNLSSPVNPGVSAFPVRTATLGGTPSPIAAPPVVNVVTGASPGDVVINELLPVSANPNDTSDESEFVELYNRTTVDLDVSGWTLTDVGRSEGCTLDSRWAFPSGTVLPAGGYLVVARTALDPNNPGNPADDRGFRVSFPGFTGALVEMFDLESPSAAPLGDNSAAADDPATPNMTLLDPHAAVDDQIGLLGGVVTNGGQCESPNVPGRIVPFAEVLVLRDVLGTVIDAVEYREIGPCAGDLCTGPLTGADDAYPFGPPKPGHSLGRSASSSDTGSSLADFLPASVATPGAANVPGDTVPPGFVASATLGLSASVIEIRYDEPVDEATATAPGNYSVVAGGQSYAVREVFGDIEAPQRHYLVVTDPIPPSASGTLSVSGVTDLVIGGTGGNVFSGSTGFTVPAEAVTVCDVQQFDESGFSPRVGETVVFAGFVTLGDIPASAPGAPPPTDRVSIWVQEPGGCGVNVFSFLPTGAADFQLEFADVREFGVQLNHFVRVRGVVTEFVSASSGSGSVTEVAGIVGDIGFYELVIVAGAGPAPIEVSTAAANDERLEGTLVHTEGTVINANALAAWIDDGSGSVQVFQNFSSLDLTRFTVGDRLDVTGVLTQFDATEPFLSGYELVPQNQDAIFEVDGSFASDGPSVQVEKRVLVPDLGETIDILARSPRRSDIIVEIYDAVGRKITTLYDGVGLGEMAFEWDGRDQSGSVVDPGVYICHARAVALDGGSVKTIAAPIVVGLRLDGNRPGASPGRMRIAD